MCRFQVEKCSEQRVVRDIIHAIRDNDVGLACEIALEAIRNRTITVRCSSHGTNVRSDSGYFLCESPYCDHNGGSQNTMSFDTLAYRYVNALVVKLKKQL